MPDPTLAEVMKPPSEWREQSLGEWVLVTRRGEIIDRIIRPLGGWTYHRKGKEYIDLESAKNA
jgi:hypothetical protein